MNFKYCRVFAWPYEKDRQKISKVYFDNMIKESKELILKLPCNFVIFLAYELQDSPFAAIALDMDYHLVANSEISQILDQQLNEPKSSSMENPGWFTTHVDSNYSSTLTSCGITLIDGCFYKGTGKSLDDASENQPKIIHVEPSLDDINRIGSKILDDPLFSGINTENELASICDVGGEVNIDEVKKLIAMGVDINSTDPNAYPYKPPLHLASSRGQIEVVKVLLGSGADPNLKASQ
ncbi:MAG TPA: ankyrin repeat domain-containing protein, partial [Gammaproteobacteria bacterium]|nr:ankyrin repeat domain-containing protein [Gammaproteobacteria bacterium]